MEEVHSQSPEERRKRLAKASARIGHGVVKRWREGPPLLVVLKRVGIGVYEDGFVHAGNIAYMSLVALFPFLILAAALARLLGNGGDAQLAVVNILARLPMQVRDVLAAPITEVLQGRSGNLLWFGAAVGLWTAASFIETIRDILRRAYGVKYCAPFWHYRLASMALIAGAVFLLLFALAASVVLSSAQRAIEAWLPFAQEVADGLALYRVIPAVALYCTIFFIFYLLTPLRYRRRGCRRWPGALLITSWWLLTAELLPKTIGLLGGYDLTYGSLAGVMVALIFFFVIGLGVVAGAELNAALAEPGGKALRGEVYEGPYRDQLPVEEPDPEEDMKTIKGKSR